MPDRNESEVSRPDKTWWFVDIAYPICAFELVVSCCWESECIGVEEISPQQLRAYYHTSSEAQYCMDAIHSLASHNGWTIQTSIDTISDLGWSTRWHQHFRQITIGTRFLVHPPWDQPDNHQRINIVIYPGQAFGTGYHESTALCLELLETISCSQMQILDAGCGSGVLGIAALKSGGRRLIGIDIDPVAVREASINAINNGVNRHAAWIAGDLSILSRGRFDLIFANIDRPTLEQAAAYLFGLLNPNGQCILSGFLHTDQESINKCVISSHSRVVRSVKKGEWGASLVQRQ